MNIAEQLVETLLEWEEDGMMHGAAATGPGPGPGAAPAPMSPEGQRRFDNLLQKCHQLFVEERVNGYSDGGRQFPPMPREQAEQLWAQHEPRFRQTLSTDPEIRAKYQLESEMPDWLKKKISGKTDDDEGGDDEGGKEKSDKPSKSKSSKASSGSDVAAVTGKVSYSA